MNDRKYKFDSNLSLPEGFKPDFTYLPHLLFKEEKVRLRSLDYWKKSGSEKRFLGIYFQEEMKKRSFPLLELKRTKEAGFGLFAKEDIPSFTLIGEYTGIVRRKSLENSNKKNRYLMQYPVGFWSLFSWVIDAKEQGNYCRWINHSKKRNVHIQSFLYDGLIHLGLVSSEKIPKGRQLLQDYGDLYWRQLKETPYEINP